MSRDAALSAIARAIDALTDEIDVVRGDPRNPLALLNLSCGMELRRISAAVGGSRLLMATAHAIDEALLALVEAQIALKAGQA